MLCVSAIHYSAVIYLSQLPGSHAPGEGLFLYYIHIHYYICIERYICHRSCDWLNWRGLIEHCSSPVWASVYNLGVVLRGKVLHLRHVRSSAHVYELNYWDRDMVPDDVCNASMGCLQPSSTRLREKYNIYMLAEVLLLFCFMFKLQLHST